MKPARVEPVPVDPEPLARIVLLTYSVGAERLVRADIPLAVTDQG